MRGLCDAVGTGSYAYRDSLDTLLGMYRHAGLSAYRQRANLRKAEGCQAAFTEVKRTATRTV